MDQKVKEAIELAVKVLVHGGSYAQGVKEGRIPFDKEEYQAEMERVEKAWKLIRECEEEGINMKWERRDVSGVERDLIEIGKTFALISR